MLREIIPSRPAVLYQHSSLCAYLKPFFLAHPTMFPMTGKSGRYSTIYIKEISSCPVKIALHSLGTDGTVQRIQKGSNFNAV